jgi:hypothetical protein
MLGVPIYPGAQFIASPNAGRGQRTTSSVRPRRLWIWTYYRNALKQKGELVYEVPAARIRRGQVRDEDRMAFPPGVVIKDSSRRLQGLPRIRNRAASPPGSRASSRSSPFRSSAAFRRRNPVAAEAGRYACST